MKAHKQETGEILYAASNDINFWEWFAEKKETEKKEKKERKKLSDERFQQAKIKYNIQPELKAVIDDNAPKYRHNRYGIGSLVSEDDKTITLIFNGELKSLPKAFTKLALL